MPIRHSAEWRAALNAASAARDLRNHRGLPIHFIAQSELPGDVAYEAHISATGGVPTRDNLHDFFNGLVWLSFPRAKVQLNAIQALELGDSRLTGQAGRPGGRGRVRDAATIFDENAALLVLREPGWLELFRAHAWHQIFVERRELFRREVDVWLFGHALMEKLVTPFKAITAHAFPLIADTTYFSEQRQGRQEWLDRAVAERLRIGLAMSDFTPLPVLGVPGWWRGQDDAFYDDETVFRPKRVKWKST